MTHSVAIVGSGPDGLLAAHAADICGWDFTVYSVGKYGDEPINPDEYLTEPIPGMTENITVVVDHHRIGTAEEYDEKIGFPDSLPIVSATNEDDWKDYAWDLQACYEKLKAAYFKHVVPASKWPGPINHNSPFVEMLHESDLVISTVPRPMWAEKGSAIDFKYAKLWRKNDVFGPKENNVVIHDGSKDVGFCIAAQVFGRIVTYWPHNRKPPIEGLEEHVIPLRTEGLPMPEGIVHFGSTAMWLSDVDCADTFRFSRKTFEEYDKPLFEPIIVANEYPKGSWATNPYAPPKD